MKVDEEMNCPKCNLIMIKRPTGIMLTSYPPQYPWRWWCGKCNHYEAGGVDWGMTDEEIYSQKFREANKGGRHEG